MDLDNLENNQHNKALVTYDILIVLVWQGYWPHVFQNYHSDFWCLLLSPKFLDFPVLPFPYFRKKVFEMQLWIGFKTLTKDLSRKNKVFHESNIQYLGCYFHLKDHYLHQYLYLVLHSDTLAYCFLKAGPIRHWENRHGWGGVQKKFVGLNP